MDIKKKKENEEKSELSKADRKRAVQAVYKMVPEGDNKWDRFRLSDSDQKVCAKICAVSGSFNQQYPKFLVLVLVLAVYWKLEKLKKMSAKQRDAEGYKSTCRGKWAAQQYYCFKATNLSKNKKVVELMLRDETKYHSVIAKLIKMKENKEIDGKLTWNGPVMMQAINQALGGLRSSGELPKNPKVFLKFAELYPRNESVDESAKQIKKHIKEQSDSTEQNDD